MNPQQTIAQIQPLLAGSRSILVLAGKNADIDAYAAMLGLYLTLPGIGKTVTAAASEPMRVEHSGLIGINNITNQLGTKNFVISFDYKEGQVEKIVSNVDETQKKLNIVVEHRGGAPLIKQENLSFGHSGASADLIFVVGTPKLSDLGDLYNLNQDLFSRVNIINLDTHPDNSNFGRVNFVFPNATGVAELVTLMLADLRVQITQDAATNLLTGLTFASHDFSGEKVSADTFEASAICFRSGAQKVWGEGKGKVPNPPVKMPPQQPMMPGQQAYQPQAQAGMGMAMPQYGAMPAYPQQASYQQPVMPSYGMQAPAVPQQSAPQTTSFYNPPIQTPSAMPSSSAPLPNQKTRDEEAPPDWLKPKIFKSSDNKSA